LAKQVVVLVRRSPLNTQQNAEALRQALGLTLADNQVTALLLDDAAWLALPLSPELIDGGEVRKHIDTLIMLEGKVLVEDQSLSAFGIEGHELIPGVEIISRNQAIAELTQAEAVISF
jgi:sulfur relay (sulfurtransferase) DsrF/TusC family protein